MDRDRDVGIFDGNESDMCDIRAAGIGNDD